MKKITLVSSLSPLALLALEENLWASAEGGGFSREFIWQVVAFVIVAFLLVKLLKKPLLGFLLKRKEEIRNSLEQASKREMEAQRLLADWERKIESMNQEITVLHETLRKEGEEERRRIIERAKEEGERIKKQTQVIAEQEVKKGRVSLKKETVDLSVELAESLLKKAIQPQDQDRLAKEYIGKLKEMR